MGKAMTNGVQMRSSGNRAYGMLLLEWVIALALLASFALLVIAFLPRLTPLLNAQQEQQKAIHTGYYEQQIATYNAGHRQLFQLQEGTP